MLDDHERDVLAVCEQQLAREEPDLDDRLRRHSWSSPARTRRELPGWLASSILLTALVLLLVLPTLVHAGTPPDTTACGDPGPGRPDRCTAGPPAPGGHTPPADTHIADVPVADAPVADAPGTDVGLPRR